MNTFEPWQKVRCYRVTGWEPPGETVKNPYGKGHNFGVVATSAVEAIGIIEKLHPAVRIDAVNETCIVHYIAASAGPAQSEGEQHRG